MDRLEGSQNFFSPEFNSEEELSLEDNNSSYAEQEVFLEEHLLEDSPGILYLMSRGAEFNKKDRASQGLLSDTTSLARNIVSTTAKVFSNEILSEKLTGEEGRDNLSYASQNMGLALSVLTLTDTISLAKNLWNLKKEINSLKKGLKKKDLKPSQTFDLEKKLEALEAKKRGLSKSLAKNSFVSAACTFSQTVRLGGKRVLCLAVSLPGLGLALSALALQSGVSSIQSSREKFLSISHELKALEEKKAGLKQVPKG